MIKTIIFDFDGTIADTFHIGVECAKEISLKYIKKKIEYKERYKDLKMWELIRELKIPILLAPFYLKKIIDLFATKADKVELFKGMKPLLKKLNKSHKIGILTTNKKEIVEEIFKNTNFHDYDYIYFANLILGKTNTFKKIFKKEKVKPHQMVYVCDEIKDIETCKKLGIITIAVSWGYNSINGLKRANPDYLAKTPKDLEKIIKTL